METSMRIYSILVVATVALIFSALLPGDANAIPAFSREHSTECTTCHTLFPELNEYGEAFYKNGFLWRQAKAGEVAAQQIEEKPAAAVPQTSGEGDPELLALLKEGAASESAPDGEEAPHDAKGKGGKNEALWISGLPTTLPLSLSGTMNAKYDNTPEMRNKLDLSSRALSLLAAGIFRDKIGFFTKYNLYTEGVDNLPASQTPLNSDDYRNKNIEEMFIVYRNIAASPLNLKVGRIRPKLSLWKKTNRVISSGNGPTSYTVGSSSFAVESPQDAVELNGIFKKRVFAATGLVDRNQQNNKEWYGHLSFRIGGTDFHGNEPEVDLDEESLWDYLSLTFGGFGYIGKNSIETSSYGNEYYRAGGELEVGYKSTRFRTSAVFGNDDNPFYGSWSNDPYKSKAFSAELENLFSVYLIGVFHFDYVNNGSTIERRYIPAIAYTPVENTKVALEYQQVRSSDVDHRVLASLRFAF